MSSRLAIRSIPARSGPGVYYIVSRRRTRAAVRVPRNRRDDACRPVGVGVSRRYYYRGTRFRGTTMAMRGTRFPYEPTCELQIEVQRLIGSCSSSGGYATSVSSIEGRKVTRRATIRRDQYRVAGSSAEWREWASATVGRPSPAGYSIRGARGSPPGSSLTRPGRRPGSAVEVPCQPPWRGGGGQCACARPAGTRTPRERPRARGRPAAPRYPRRTHPATRDRFPATPAEAFRDQAASRRGSAAGSSRRSRGDAVRTTLGFALGMICARMNYSTPTVVYGYAHECGMRARAPARRGASVGAQPAERPASARTSS